MFIVTATYHPTAHWPADSVETVLNVLANETNGEWVREMIRHTPNDRTRSPRYQFDVRSDAEDFKAGLELRDPHFKPIFTTTLVEEKE